MRITAGPELVKLLKANRHRDPPLRLTLHRVGLQTRYPSIRGLRGIGAVRQGDYMKTIITLALFALSVGTANAQKITSAADMARVANPKFVNLSDLGQELLAHNPYVQGMLAGIVAIDDKVCPDLAVTYGDMATMIGNQAVSYIHAHPTEDEQLERGNAVPDFLKSMAESDYPCK